MSIPTIKNLIEEFEKGQLEKMAFESISIWINKKRGFPLINKLLKLVCVMPMVFSALNFIKNKLRNIIADEFLDDLLLIFLETDLVNKILKDKDLQEKIIDTFRDL